MPFKDYQKHCTECKRGEPCGKYHLYVMKLHPSIWEKKRFREVNPGYIYGSPLYYVGKTKHHPRCRQSQHQNYSTERESKWKCYCQVNPGRHPYKGPWESPSRFVRGYTDGYLLAEPRDPLPDSKSAENAERLLAEKLRRDGCGVWAGHHDMRPKKKKKKKRRKT
tara:strand:- start:101 stop:595 length:495 start_codon:yes stop_codon:yes gene_type:complete